jgi:ribonucleoside-diphosphate reductase alpha chain
MLRQISSTGYLPKRLPQELVVLQGGNRTRALDAGLPSTGANIAVALHAETSAEALTVATLDVRTRARMQGYEGDPCGECGNYTLVRNGTCPKCNT